MIEVKELRKTYGQRVAVSGISFDVRPGEVVVFLGPNGAGKSTTLRIIMGLRRPTAGTVRVLKGDPRDLKVRDKIGFAGQDINFPAHLRTREILNFVKQHFTDHMAIDELADRLDLRSFFERFVGGLSGGERRRLGLACALVGRPQVLILDEPTTALDTKSKRQLWREILAFRNAGGAVLLSTHDLHDAAEIADRVLLMDQGRILVSGKVQEIINPLNLKKISFSLPNGTYEEHWSRNPDDEVRELVRKGVMFMNLQISAATLEEAIQNRLTQS